ncbi:hypothetical protein J1614_003132 [Plenodomus biglobosus]|nr:hypothetical protein J1614_003132 [Plenodomus biglobosus]
MCVGVLAGLLAYVVLRPVCTRAKQRLHGTNRVGIGSPAGSMGTAGAMAWTDGFGHGQISRQRVMASSPQRGDEILTS